MSFGLMWGIAPIVLGILVLVLAQKNKKLETELFRLRSLLHKNDSTTDVQHQPPQQQQQQQQQPQQQQQQPQFYPGAYSHLENTALKQSEGDSENPDTPSRNLAAAQTQSVVVSDKIYDNSKHRHIGATTGLLILGVVFIVMAGFVFVTTTWSILPNIARIACIVLLIAVFFTAAHVLKTRLKIGSTSIAFFLLGSFFISVGVVGTAYFNLLGRYFYMYGSGLQRVVALASFFVCFAMVFGVKIYRKKQFAFATLICLSLSLCFFAKSIGFRNDVVYLIFAVICALFVGATYLPVQRVTAPWQEILPLFSTINLFTVAAISLPFGKSTVLFGISAVAFALLFLSKPLLVADKEELSLLPFTIIILLSAWRFNISGDADILALFISFAAVAVFTVGYIKFKGEQKNILFTVTSMVTACVTLVAILFSVWNNTPTLFSIVAAVIIYTCSVVSAKRGDKVFCHFNSVLLITVLVLISNYLPFNYIVQTVVFSVLCVSGFAIYDRLRLRTIFSDLVFLFCLLRNTIELFSKGDYYLSLSIYIMFLAVMIYCCIRRRAENAERYFKIILRYIFVFAFICSLAILSKIFSYEFMRWCKIGYQLMLLCVFGVLLFLKRQSGKGFLLPITVGILVFSYIECFAGLIADDKILYVGSAYAVVAFFAINLLAATKGGKAVFPQKADPVYLYGVAIQSYLALLFTAAAISPKILLSRLLLVPTCAAVATYLIYIFFCKKLHRFAIHLDIVSCAAMVTLLTFLAPLYIVQNQSMFNLFVIIALIALLCFELYKKRIFVFSIVALFWVYPLLFAFNNRIGISEIQGFAVAVLVGLLLAVVSRRLFLKTWHFEKNNAYQLDWLSIINISILPFLPTVKHDNFFVLILLSVFFLQFLGRVPFKRINITIIATLLYMAYLMQEFYIWPQIISSEMALLGGILLMVTLHLFVWKTEVSALLLFIASTLSVIILLGGALISHDIVDALIIGLYSAVLLIIAIKIQSRRWFFMAFASLLSLTLYMTRTLWLSIAWWIYLLLFGALFIFLAATRESRQQNGIKLIEYFKRWKK